MIFLYRAFSVLLQSEIDKKQENEDTDRPRISTSA